MVPRYPVRLQYPIKWRVVHVVHAQEETKNQSFDERGETDTIAALPALILQMSSVIVPFAGKAYG